MNPQGPVEIHAGIEEEIDPHAHADEALGEGDDIIGPDVIKQIDDKVRITLKDCKQFGFTDGCPTCLDLHAGAFRTSRNHSEECRLRMYLS